MTILPIAVSSRLPWRRRMDAYDRQVRRIRLRAPELWALIIVFALILLTGCSSGPSERAQNRAELYCTLEGVLPPGTSIYSDEYARCVEENVPRFEDD